MQVTAVVFCQAGSVGGENDMVDACCVRRKDIYIERDVLLPRSV
jgi:hypothetical protein